MKYALTLALLAVTVGSFSSGAACQADESATEKSDAQWQTLFDGTSTDAFRNYKKETLSDGWQIIDGALVRAKDGAGDIVTKDEFGAFELELEFKISPAGNSGVMYRVTEDNPAPWHSGPEIQIQDNKDGHDPQKCGWLYQLYAADVDATKPAGQWNRLRVVITPDKCQHFVNGVKYVQYDIGSDEWDKRVANSKFAQFEGFGEAERGHICLQDHGDKVAYRNIRIRVLD